MPYFISDTADGCDGWATIKEGGEVMGCHMDKQDAIDQALAIAEAEESEYLGERAQFPSLEQRVPVPGMDRFTTEAEALARAKEIGCEGAHTMEQDGETIYMPCSTHAAYDALKGDDSDTEEPYSEENEQRQVDLAPPAYMRASARRGLEWHSEGLSGDGLVDATIREARAMTDGNVTTDKWTRIAAWIARHIDDLDAPAADPDHPDYPSPGVVAMALWGGGVTRKQANRTLEYARGVVRRIEAENQGRAKGEAVSKMETRIFETPLELREDGEGMHLEGYAAIFNSRSENLGGFTEVIERGAFGGSLRSRNDVKFLWNHDTGSVLGSTRAGTLTLSEDERGLKVSAILPNTTLGRDTRELVRRQDVTGFSFGFSMPARGGDTWSSDGTERTLKVVRLHEVSLVSFPAYTATNGTATVRGLERVCQRANVDADALADALLKMESGVDLNAGDRAVVETVLGELSPNDEPADSLAEDKGADILALKKAKLKLLMSDF